MENFVIVILYDTQLILQSKTYKNNKYINTAVQASISIYSVVIPITKRMIV